MTSKIYRSAQGKTVDLGTIMLQNEHVRAVGNMKVNARGDKIDSLNRVIETKPQQIQRQNDRVTTTMSSTPAQTSSAKVRQATQPVTPTPNPAPEPEPVVEVAPPAPEPEPVVEVAPPVVEVAPPAPEPEPVVEVAPPVVEVAPSRPAIVIDKFAPKPQIAPAPKPQTPPPEVNLKNPEKAPKSPVADDSQPKKGGLAGAIARTREIKQDLDRTRRQQAQDQGVRKI